MDSHTVAQAARATLDGSIPFPEVVGRLLQTGVESYHVDYMALEVTYYSVTGESMKTPLSYEGLPPVAASFDPDALRAAIADSQTRGQHFRDFTRRAMLAGVQAYMAFLHGKRVTYWGRHGDQHIEWFPGAKP